MHLARFLWNNRIRWGIVKGNDVWKHRGNLFRNARAGDYLGPLAHARILPPLERTNKVVAIAANYGEKDDRDGPGIFMKQPGTNIGHRDPIVYPQICTKIIHEAELGIVIGKTARHVATEAAIDHVFGYTCCNDISAREMTTSDLGRGQSMRWKNFDTFCPVGPTIATGLDGDNLRIQCRVNGKTDVDGSTRDMIFGVAELINWVSRVMTLNPGDIISSGCPVTAEIQVGDTVEVEIEGIGTLTNPVVSEC